MSDATDLWDAVVVSYDSGGLTMLSNINAPDKESVDVDRGEDAAQAVIDLFPAYAQVAYSASTALHVQVAKRGVIAMLWEWGGASVTISEVKWDAVFADDGLMGKIRKVGPRARQSPSSNSNLSQASGLTSSGRRFRPWADPESLPRNFLPLGRVAE